MRENLLSMDPGRFSTPGETEIKQFIGKLTQTNKANDPLKSKSKRGRKAGNRNRSWYMLLNELIDKNPSEKSETILCFLIVNLGDNLPDDLPKTTENVHDKKKLNRQLQDSKPKSSKFRLIEKVIFNFWQKDKNYNFGFLNSNYFHLSNS